jgi:hypothetical protein
MKSSSARLAFAVFAPLFVAAVAAGPGVARAGEIKEVLPLTDRILMVHVDEGHVIHHISGQPRSQEKVVISPLDVAAASKPETYSLVSTDDPAYAAAKVPTDVGRKSKGTNYAWFADRWENGRAVNDRPDHTKDHWIYLYLPSPLQRGKTYTLTTGSLNTKGDNTFKFVFDEKALRSEAVHVNLLGYVPEAPMKVGSVFHWAGDRGSVDFKPYAGKPFQVVETGSGKTVLTGTLAFRKAANNPETLHKTDSPPDGSFIGADVYEADFSELKTPGEYKLVVEGVGSSFPFKIDADAYRPAYRATVRALYHNRSGIELKEPYTKFTRPAPGHPKLTPGFADKLRYSTLKWTEYGGENPPKEKLEPTLKGTLEDAWGWYQDAGDWDGYFTHFRVPQELLLAFDLAPQNFKDNENNIPESGNGIPDILDEASWLPRWGYRLRQELMRKGWGTGGIGSRVAGDVFGHDEGTNPDGSRFGRGSWQDNDRIYAVSGEDPESTFRYAGCAAQLANALRSIGAKDPEGVDWAKEAVEAYAWALKNSDVANKSEALRDSRAYASAALFKLTGEKSYEKQFASDTDHIKADSPLWHEGVYAPFLYALTSGAGPEGKVASDPATRGRIRAAVLHNADMAVSVAERRALRWGGKWDMPMLIGQQTTPWAHELAVGYLLTRSSDPAKARKYLATLYTTADHFLGNNSLNMVWMTGVGPRNVTEMFHMDAWYNGGDGPSKGYQEGLIPYSPWRKEKDLGQGPWDVAWAHKTLYPSIDSWPGNERWFPNRCTPLGLEFTVHQNIGPAASYYGILASPGITATK